MIKGLTNHFFPSFHGSLNLSVKSIGRVIRALNISSTYSSIIFQKWNNDNIQGISRRTGDIYTNIVSFLFSAKEYLSVLVENGLIKKYPQQANDKAKFAYRITEKGLRFLRISQDEHKDNTIRSDASKRGKEKRGES